MMNPPKVELLPPIPADTADAAQFVIRTGNFYLSIGRQANSLFTGLDLESQSHALDIPRCSLARLYLITTFQFIEILADSQVTDALQKRVDWKYALHLPLNNTDLPHMELCEFRKWMKSASQSQEYLYRLVARLSEITQARKKPRLISPVMDIVSQVCMQNRLAIVWFAISAALHELADRQIFWFGTIYLPHWYDRYGKSAQVIRIANTEHDQMNLAKALLDDAFYLLDQVINSGRADLINMEKVNALEEVLDGQVNCLDGRLAGRKGGCNKCPLDAEQHS